MADVPGDAIDGGLVIGTRGGRRWTSKPGGVVLLGGSGGGVAGPTLYFKMRAQVDPGPGYETWVVQDTPDYAGTNAPGPIFGGTVIVAEEWAS